MSEAGGEADEHFDPADFRFVPQPDIRAHGKVASNGCRSTFPTRFAQAFPEMFVSRQKTGHAVIARDESAADGLQRRQVERCLFARIADGRDRFGQKFGAKGRASVRYCCSCRHVPLSFVSAGLINSDSKPAHMSGSSFTTSRNNPWK